MSVRRLRGARGRIIVAPASEASAARRRRLKHRAGARRNPRSVDPAACAQSELESMRTTRPPAPRTASTRWRVPPGPSPPPPSHRQMQRQLVGAEGERALEQPEVGANEGVVARRQRAERDRRFARRLVEPVDDGAKARLPGGAVDHRQQRRGDELALGRAAATGAAARRAPGTLRRTAGRRRRRPGSGRGLPVRRRSRRGRRRCDARRRRRASPGSAAPGGRAHRPCGR